MAKRLPHYEVDSDNKQVKIYCMDKITDKEWEIVKKYLSVKYEMIDLTQALKDQKKAKKEEKQKNADSTWKEETIRKYIEENGTEEQKKQYNEIIKSPTDKKAVYSKDVYQTEEWTDDNNNKHKRTVYDENGNKILLHKKGELKLKSHVAVLSWFKRNFPEYK